MSEDQVPRNLLQNCSSLLDLQHKDIANGQSTRQMKNFFGNQLKTSAIEAKSHCYTIIPLLNKTLQEDLKHHGMPMHLSQLKLFVEVNKVSFAYVVNFESQQFPQNIIYVTTAITSQLQPTSSLHKTSITPAP
jgi:hypothetical protein